MFLQSNIQCPISRDQPFLRICGLKEELKSSAELWLSKHSWQMRHLTNFSNKLRSVRRGWAGQVKIVSLRRNGFAYNTMKIDKYEDDEDCYSKTNITFYRN